MCLVSLHALPGLALLHSAGILDSLLYKMNEELTAPGFLHARSRGLLLCDGCLIEVQVKVPQLMHGDLSENSCLLSPQFAWLLSSRLPAKQVPDTWSASCFTLIHHST